jgi:hypothetical protein
MEDTFWKNKFINDFKPTDEQLSEFKKNIYYKYAYFDYYQKRNLNIKVYNKIYICYDHEICKSVYDMSTMELTKLGSMLGFYPEIENIETRLDWKYESLLAHCCAIDGKKYVTNEIIPLGDGALFFYYFIPTDNKIKFILKKLSYYNFNK